MARLPQPFPLEAFPEAFDQARDLAKTREGIADMLVLPMVSPEEPDDGPRDGH